MIDPEGISAAAHMAVEALFIQIQDIAAARVLGFGGVLIAAGLHILIREPIGK